MTHHHLRFTVALGAIAASFLGGVPAVAQQGSNIEIPALPNEQIYIFEGGCKILKTVSDKDLKAAPALNGLEWSGACRDGLAHGSGVVSFKQEDGTDYNLYEQYYYGRKEAKIFPDGSVPEISITSDRYHISISNVDLLTMRAPAMFPRDPNWNRTNSLKKDDIMEPYIMIEDKTGKEIYSMMILGDSNPSDIRLAVSHDLDKKDNGRFLKCSSYDRTRACSREWNAQIDNFWKSAKPLYDRAIAEAVALQNAERRKIDVLMEPMRVALGQSYSGAPFTAEELAWAKQMRDARTATLAAATQQQQVAATAAANQVAAEQKQKAAIEAESGIRRSAYAATPAAKAAGVTLAAKAFSVPAAAAKVAVMIIDDSENKRFEFDTGLLELPDDMEPIYVAPDNQVTINTEVAKLKQNGVKTLYVIDLTRWQLWVGPVAAKITSAEVTVATSVRDNPDYPQLVAQLESANQELAAAKIEYDRMNAAAHSGGYGTGTAGLISGLFSAVTKSTRYSNAETTVIRLKEAIDRTEPQIRTVSKRTVGFADSSFKSTFSGRIGVAACDLVVSRCAERERVIESNIVVAQPLVLIQGDPNYAERIAQDKAATVALNRQRETDGKIGFSVAAMGKYVSGLPMFVPLGKLAAWQKFAYEDFDRRFTQRNATDAATNTALLKKLAPVAASLKGVKFVDPTGIIRKAGEAVAIEERRKDTQGLE